MLGSTAKTKARQDKVQTQVEGETSKVRRTETFERCELSEFEMSWIVCSQRRCRHINVAGMFTRTALRLR